MAEAEARKAEAEARKAEFENRFPALDASKLQGKTELKDGEFIETRLQGYRAMDTAAMDIAEKIKRKPAIKSLVVYHPDSVASLQRYLFLINRIKLVRSRYDFIINQGVAKGCPAPPAVAALAPGAAAAVLVNLLSFFKTDVTIKPSEFDIDEKDLVAALFHHLEGANINLYYPKVIPIGTTPGAPSPLLGELKAALQKQDDASSYLTCAQFNAGEQMALGKEFLKAKTDLDGILKELELLLDTPAPPPPAGGAGGPAAPAAGGAPPAPAPPADPTPPKNALAEYLKAEALYQTMSAGGYWIDLKVTKAGGSARIKSTPIIDVFTGGSRIKFSGGAIVSYTVFDLNGRVALSNTLTQYIPYKTSKNINK